MYLAKKLQQILLYYNFGSFNIQNSATMFILKLRVEKDYIFNSMEIEQLNYSKLSQPSSMFM